MGLKPSAPTPFPPRKKKICKGPFCEVSTGRANGYCSEECEEWAYLLEQEKEYARRDLQERS